MKGLPFYCHTGACVAGWSDAAHASRRDLSSQGGSLIALTDPCFLEDKDAPSPS